MSALVEGSRLLDAVGALPVAGDGGGEKVCVVTLRIGHGASHPSPDDLAEASQTVRSCLREDDLVIPSRDGVLVLLGSGFGIDDAVRVADRVRHRLAESAPRGGRIVSAGVAVGVRGEPVLEAMARAERALGQACAAGGNCTVARSVNCRRR